MDRVKRRVILTVLLVVGILFCSAISLADDSAKPLRVHGATTVANLIDPWVSEFESKGPTSRVVIFGSTHGKGLKALMEGTADVAMTARAISPDELKSADQKGLKLSEQRICYDAVAIIVNKENPVNELSLDQLSKIFSGSYTNWSQVGGADEPIVVMTLPPDSGMASFLSRDVLKTAFAPNAMVERSPREVVTRIQGRKGAISFCRTNLALSGSAGHEIKVLAIKKDDASPAVPLSKETIASGKFPIIRPLGFAYDGSKGPIQAKEFVDFCLAKYNRTSE